MTLTKSPKTGVYSAVIQTDHGRRTISTGTSDRREAAMLVKDAKVKELESAAKVHRLTGRAVQQIVAGKKVTMADAVGEWVTWLENYGRANQTVHGQMKTVERWIRDGKLADRLPSEISEKHVDVFVNSADASALSTRKIKLSAIRSFYKFCCAKAYAIGNPAALVRVKMNLLTHAQKEGRAIEAFTEEELTRLSDYLNGEIADARSKLAAILKRNQTGNPDDLPKYAQHVYWKSIAAIEYSTFWNVAVSIGRWTGLRMGDICQLEWDCFAVPGRISVWTDKRDVRVSLPLTLAEHEKDVKAGDSISSPEITAHYKRQEAELIPCISSVPAAHKLFLFPIQHDLTLDPKVRSNLSVQFGRILQYTGITNKSFHGIRSFYCTTMDKLGVPIQHISRSVGHRDTLTTRGYIR